MELMKSRDLQMHDPRKITNFSISTVSTEPLRGIVEIDTFDSTVKFELSEDTALKIDQEVKRFVTDAYKRAPELLSANKETLVKMAEALLQREVLDAWRTSCPRLPVWETAEERGFIDVAQVHVALDDVIER